MYMTEQEAFTVDDVAPLDTSSFVPLYLQLANTLALLIQQKGSDAVGKALPSELQFASRFRISRPTVRQAMSQLLSRGLITRIKGRGTFVAPLSIEHNVAHGFEDELRAAHKEFGYKLIAWERARVPDAVAAAFKALPGLECHRLTRLRRVEGEIVGVEERYVPTAIGYRLKLEELESQPIIDLLTHSGSDKPARLDIEVRSLAAARDLARLLEVKTGAPLLQRTTTFLSATGQPLMHGTVTFLAQHYRFRATVNYSC